MSSFLVSPLALLFSSGALLSVSVLAERSSTLNQSQKTPAGSAQDDVRGKAKNTLTSVAPK